MQKISAKKITLIFLLYNASRTVHDLVEAALAQRHPGYAEQGDWLDVVFVDDCSRDDTVTLLRQALAANGSPRHFRVVINSENLGLSATLNKVFGLIATPFGLTCHLDVLFGRDDYAAGMLRLMEANPEAGAITGQPALFPGATLPLAEKLNAICNMMDLFPVEGDAELVPVGFAEGRCDIFRVAALKAAGLWDDTLRTSGEDQLLAARMRQEGYRIYQAPKLTYYLSVSEEQNSLVKLLRHAHLFGRTQPYILLTNRENVDVVAGAGAGGNRSRRTFLRLSQVAGGVAYPSALIGAFSGMPAAVWLSPLAALALHRAYLLHRHLAEVRLTVPQWLVFLLFVPLHDLCYAVGAFTGIGYCLGARKGKVIR